MQLKEQKKKLREAEKRAIQAERTVKNLLKEVDMKEGKGIKIMPRQGLVSLGATFLSTTIAFQTSSEKKRRNTRRSATTWTPHSQK